MANPPNVANPQIGHFSAGITLPEHATVMRRLYVSCQVYAAQGKSVKARMITAVFLLAVPFTCAKYAIQAPLCLLWDFARLRNGFSSFGTKIAELINCLAFGLFQTTYLLCNISAHMNAIRDGQQQLAQLNARADAQRNAIREKEETLNNFQKQIDTLQTQIAHLQAQAKPATEDETEKLQETIARLNRDNAAILIEKQKAVNDLSALRASVDVEKTNEKKAQKEDKENIRNLENLNQLQAEQEHFKAEVKKLQKELDTTRQTAIRVNDRKNKLEVMVKDFKDKAEANNQEIERLNKELTELRNEQKAQLERERALSEQRSKTPSPDLEVTSITQSTISSGKTELPVDLIPPSPLTEEEFYLMQINEELISQEDVAEYVVWENKIMQEVWTTTKSYIKDYASSIYAVYSKIEDQIFNIFIDGKAQWKVHRYSLMAKHHQAFNQFYEQLQHQFAARKGPQEEIIRLFGEAYKELRKLDAKVDPRAYHKAFVQLLRPALDRMFQLNGHLPRDFFNFVVENMDKRFSETYVNTYYRKLVYWMASEGNSDLDVQLKKATLSEKLRLIHQGIKNADVKFKSPKGHITWKKMDGIKSKYDPLGDTNHPSIMGTARYQNAQGHTKEVKLMRTGVPVCGRSSDPALGDKYWELQDVALAPEYLQHCHQMLNQNKNMLVILHLDPAKLIELGEYRAPVSTIDYLKTPDLALKMREALWINLFRKLGQEFANRINVCVFPLDGEWIHKMQQEKAQTKDEYVRKLKEFLTENGSPFKLPSFVWCLDDEKNGKKQTAEEHALINIVVDEVANTYFPTGKDAKDRQVPPSDMFDAADRKAFLMLFYSRMTEHLRMRHNIDFEQRNCKDAVDRTEAIAGVHLADLNNRLGRIQDPEVQAKIIAETEGPALAHVKREVLSSRQSYAEAGIRRLEKNLGMVPPAIDGYTLVDFDFHSDEGQRLTPDNSPASSPATSRDPSPKSPQHL